MIVPVWFETRELGCCIGVLRPGSRIEVFPLAHELLAVSHPDEVTPGWWARDDGTVEFTAVAPRAADPYDRLPPVVLDVGSLTIACRRIPRPGPVRARARLDCGSHDAVERDQQDLVGITGNGHSGPQGSRHLHQRKPHRVPPRRPSPASTVRPDLRRRRRPRLRGRPRLLLTCPASAPEGRKSAPATRGLRRAQAGEAHVPAACLSHLLDRVGV